MVWHIQKPNAFPFFQDRPEILGREQQFLGADGRITGVDRKQQPTLRHRDNPSAEVNKSRFIDLSSVKVVRIRCPRRCFLCRVNGLSIWSCDQY